MSAALFLSTVCPTVPGGDSGELITVAHTLGVAHPPGYPLFTLLGAVADRVSDVGEPAWRINVLGALMAAVGAGLTYLLARRCAGAVWPAVAGAALSALSIVSWRHASGAEVFGLNVALNVGAVLAVLALDDALRERRAARRAALLVGLLFGLGMSNHHTTSLVALGCLGALGWRVGRATVSWKPAVGALGWSLVGAAVGLLPYGYLPWAAGRDPLLAWGQTDTWEGFWRHVTRADYGSLQLVSDDIAADSASVLAAPAFLLARLGPLTSWIAPVTLVLFVVACLRRNQLTGDSFARGLVLVLAIVTGPVFFLLFNAPLDSPLLQGVVERFMILPLAFVGVLGACGLAALPLAPRLRDGLCLAVVVVLVARNHAEVDMSDVTFSRDFGRDVLASVPPGAIFFSRSDLVTNTVEYNQFCLGRRPDVLVVDQEKLTYPWYAARTARRDARFTLPWPEGVDERPRYDGKNVTSEMLFAAHIERMPVAVVDPKDGSWQRSFERVARGLVSLAVPRGAVPPYEQLFAIDEQLAATLERPDPDDFPHDGFEREGCLRYGEAFFAMGYTAEQAGQWARAAEHYEEATTQLAGTERAWRPWLNLGVVLQRTAGPAAAAEAWQACLDAWERHGHLQDPSDPGPPVEQLRAAIAAPLPSDEPGDEALRRAPTAP